MMFSEYLLAKARKMFYKVEIKGQYCFIYLSEEDFLRERCHLAWNNTMLLWCINRHEHCQKYRNYLGRLSFRLGKYEVENAGHAPYRIVEVLPYLRLNARFDTTFCEEVPEFGSWIKAVKFLKEHVEELL